MAKLSFLQALMRISNLLEEHSVTSHCVEPSSALQNHHVKKVPSSKNFMIMVVLFMSVMTIMIMMMNINGALQKMVTTWRMKVTLIMISGFHTSGSWNLINISLLIERAACDFLVEIFILSCWFLDCFFPTYTWRADQQDCLIFWLIFVRFVWGNPTPPGEDCQWGRLGTRMRFSICVWNIEHSYTVKGQSVDES